MARLSISNPVAGLDGVEFLGIRDGVAQKFVLYRDGLEDIEDKLIETDDELLDAFSKHAAHIAQVAAKALDDGKGGPKPVVLQTLFL
ncbi:DUF1488 family protein [Caenimonas aquaedulcis]|uniref:DUF1488 family protein n=1 Tax=Caenimonas aquaedulcis TaxID=2793270 RepID=A0A931H168_9BURK|nr:DUF1488 family protein [Caenimonas aquaedulcis]MBG9386681.1 DUF1488 family protein [Caenimonas aquaedulcis]